METVDGTIQKTYYLTKMKEKTQNKIIYCFFGICLFVIGIEIGILLQGGFEPTKEIEVEKIVLRDITLTSPLSEKYVEFELRKSLSYEELAELGLKPSEYDFMSDWEKRYFDWEWNTCTSQGWDSMICILEESAGRIRRAITPKESPLSMEE